VTSDRSGRTDFYSQLSKVDRKMLKLLLDSGGKIAVHELSEKLDIPLSTAQRMRKRLEETYLIKSYSVHPTKFGYRRIDFLISTQGVATIQVGKELLKQEEVTSAFRTIGEHTIDLRV
jgi:DNA-binding Lrp family transcriptional regulator